MKSGKLIVVFVVVFLFAAGFTVKTYADQAPPPVFGCLGLGEHECSFLQIAPPKANLSVNGKPLKGHKRIVHYGDTIMGSVTYKNTGTLPLNISKMGVIAKPNVGKYEVMFTPSMSRRTLQPGQSANLPVTFHKFNYPDPPGDWTVRGRVTDGNNQSVDDNNPDNFELVGDCTPLRATDPTGDAAKLNEYCKGKTDDPLCKEFCAVKPDLAQNCPANTDQQDQGGQTTPKKGPGDVCTADTECETGLVCRIHGSGGINSNEKHCLAAANSLPDTSVCRNDSECKSNKCRSVGGTYQCTP